MFPRHPLLSMSSGSASTEDGGRPRTSLLKGEPVTGMPESGVADRRRLLVAQTERVSQLGLRASLPLLRVSLGIVFMWFGALKLTNSTPVAELVANTVPFLPSEWFVPALGVFEVLLGLALLIGRYLGLVILLMVGHLAGTFLVLVTQPAIAFQDGNPLLLTMTGEFVVKNVVLMTAGLVLATWSRQRRVELAAVTPAA